MDRLLEALERTPVVMTDLQMRRGQTVKKATESDQKAPKPTRERKSPLDPRASRLPPDPMPRVKSLPPDPMLVRQANKENLRPVQSNDLKRIPKQERHLDHPTARSRQGRLLNNSSDKETHDYQRQHLIITCINTPQTLTSLNPAISVSFYASLPLVVSGKAPVFSLLYCSIYVIVIPFHVTCHRACIGVDQNF
jgi:hypothetical protein